MKAMMSTMKKSVLSPYVERKVSELSSRQSFLVAKLAKLTASAVNRVHGT